MPRDLSCDRDRIFGDDFRKQVRAMGIQSPWQRAYEERVIETICRECLDHVMVFNQAAAVSQPTCNVPSNYDQSPPTQILAHTGLREAQ